MWYTLEVRIGWFADQRGYVSAGRILSAVDVRILACVGMSGTAESLLSNLRAPLTFNDEGPSDNFADMLGRSGRRHRIEQLVGFFESPIGDVAHFGPTISSTSGAAQAAITSMSSSVMSLDNERVTLPSLRASHALTELG